MKYQAMEKAINVFLHTAKCDPPKIVNFFCKRLVYGVLHIYNLCITFVVVIIVVGQVLDFIEIKKKKKSYGDESHSNPSLCDSSPYDIGKNKNFYKIILIGNHNK